MKSANPLREFEDWRSKIKKIKQEKEEYSTAEKASEYSIIITVYLSCDYILKFFFRQFNWHAVPEREKKRHSNPAEPVWSPTMAGGLFSIDRAFFERLGTYDSGFDIWGGENLELSFKSWMCGGMLAFFCLFFFLLYSPLDRSDKEGKNVSYHTSYYTRFIQTFIIYIRIAYEKPRSKLADLENSLITYYSRANYSTERRILISVLSLSLDRKSVV